MRAVTPNEYEALRMADRIELSGIAAEGVHGLYADEALAPQPFTVDLTLWLDMTAAVAAYLAPVAGPPTRYGLAVVVGSLEARRGSRCRQAHPARNEILAMKSRPKLCCRRSRISLRAGPRSRPVRPWSPIVICWPMQSIKAMPAASALRRGRNLRLFRKQPFGMILSQP